MPDTKPITDSSLTAEQIADIETVQREFARSFVAIGACGGAVMVAILWFFWANLLPDIQDAILRRFSW